MEVIPEYDGHRLISLTVTGDNLQSTDLKTVSFRDLRAAAPSASVDISEELAYLTSHRPKKGPGNLDTEFYTAFAKAYLALAHTNRPLKELADRLELSINRMKSWSIQARKHGFLAVTSGKGSKSPGPGPKLML
jgi:hypothetical protein